MNNRSGAYFTEERIDKALANPKGMELFSRSNCTVLPIVKSDHSPISILLMRSSSQTRRKSFIFRYDAAWDLIEIRAGVMKEAWQGGSNSSVSLSGIQNSLRNCKVALLKCKNSWQNKEGEGKRTKLNLLGHI